MTHTRTLLATAVLSLVPLLAQAADMPEYARAGRDVRAPEIAPSEAVYIGLRGGFNTTSDTDYRIATTSPITDVTSSYKSGYFGAAHIGYDFGEFYDNLGARIELEGGYFVNPVKSHRITKTDTATGVATSATYTDTMAKGEANAVYAMVNYNIDWLLGSFRPFIGAGIGIAATNLNNQNATGFAGTKVGYDSSKPFMSDRDMSLVWNVTAGVGYEISPSWTIEAAYRFFRVEDINVSAYDVNNATVTAITSKTSMINHQVFVGMRYKF